MIHANFTVLPSLTGDVYATNFTFTNTTTCDIPIKKYIWNFGETEDVVYDNIDTEYIYSYPGSYTITLTAVDILGNSSTFSNQVSVDYVYRDFILYTSIPEIIANPGEKTETPFKVTILTNQIHTPIVLNLFCTNSKSIPYEFTNTQQWSFLSPNWKFLDKDDTFITSLTVDSIPVYKNNRVVALSGESEFYFVDSSSPGNPQINCPLLLTCTLETSSEPYPLQKNIYSYPGYANNITPRAVLVWHVNDIQPNFLKISSNYIDGLLPSYWKDIKIPFIITAHNDRSITVPKANKNISNIIFQYPSNTFIGETSSINIALSSLSSQEYIIDEAPLNFKLKNENSFQTGGYIFTTVTPLQTAEKTVLKVEALAYPPNSVNNEKFLYPGIAGPNTFVWVSNPQRNTLNKINLIPYPNNCREINYYKEQKTLIDGSIKNVKVPERLNSSTFNYNMSGFSGIYSMAVDPKDYSLLATDAELDRIYRFSYAGELLKTFELSSLNDYNAEKKAFFQWTFNLTDTVTANDSYFLNGSYFLSSKSKNYIVSIGGVIQPPSNYTINPKDRTIQFSNILTNYNLQGIKVNVVQIFHSLLPSNYIDTLENWEFNVTTSQSIFNLPSNNSLNSNPNYYIVTINGILQATTSYTIDNINNTLIFSQNIEENSIVVIWYIPSLTVPASWSEISSQQLLTIPLSDNSNYIPDNNTYFLINIGGVFQPNEFYTHDTEKQTLSFNVPVPQNTPVHITQINILDAIYAPAAYTPASITLDKNSNFWVTLFNSVSVLKFNPDFDLLLSTTPKNLLDPELIFDGDFLLKPPAAETDQLNNCWVSYAHPLCSFLIKYDTQGNVISQITLPDYSVPVDLAINVQNNVWVSNVFNVLSADGNIQLYDSETLIKIDELSDIPRPGYLALDINNNVWFTHSVNGIGLYNITKRNIYNWKVDDNGFTPLTSINLLKNDKTYNNDEIFGGLAVDSFNRVWVIDSYDNTAKVILSADEFFTNESVRTINIKPESILGYYIDLITGETVIESNPNNIYKSAQASGDWTGNKWYQKYVTPNVASSLVLSGISTSFEIENFINKYEIRKTNESFNMSGYLKSLALPEILQNNTFLWDYFLGSVIGTASPNKNQDIGQISYEKIANFVTNHADIDTCNIDQLLSLAQLTDTTAADYATELPFDIKRMLDIASISQNRLQGSLDTTPLLKQSIGTELNYFTDYIDISSKIILKNKFTNSYSLIGIPLLNNQNIYPLSSLDLPELIKPLQQNYQFFTYIPVFSNNFIENIIDWNSPYTALSPTLSSFNQWYGDNGIIEHSFKYLLTKNIFLK